MSRRRSAFSPTSGATLPPGVPAEVAGFPLVVDRTSIASVFGWSVRTVEARVKKGTFPIPHLKRLLPDLGWSKADVIDFFARRSFDPTDTDTPETAHAR